MHPLMRDGVRLAITPPHGAFNDIPFWHDCCAAQYLSKFKVNNLSVKGTGTLKPCDLKHLDNEVSIDTFVANEG